MVSSMQSTAQLYFDTGKGFNERESVTANVSTGTRFQTLSFALPAAKIWQLRFDPLATAGTVSIRNVRIRYRDRMFLKVEAADILPLWQIASGTQHGAEVVFSPGDSQIVFRYQPTYFYWTLAAAVFAALAIVHSLMYGRRTKGERR